ncbi:MAG: hypothetical protein ACLGHN_00035 [Bacteriovoracia bacterium]
MRFILLLILLVTFPLRAEISAFQKGTHELGLANLGIGYSSQDKFAVSASVRYQYYVLNRFAMGAFGFYNNFNDHEWMGAGPVTSYILFKHLRWFMRADQEVTLAKFNGFSDPPATLFGTTSLSINYLPEYSNFFLGIGYARTYALNEGRVLRPNALQIFAGWLWN